MEAAGESPLLIAFADQAQAAWPLIFFRTCVLNIYLVRKTVGLGSLPSPAGPIQCPFQTSAQGDGRGRWFLKSSGWL